MSPTVIQKDSGKNIGQVRVRNQTEKTMKIHLETERLTLREFTLDDIESLVDLDSDPDVMRYITDGRPQNEAHQRDFLEKIRVGDAQHPGFGFFAALEKLNLEFAGWFHYRPDRGAPEYMEIGYRLKKSAWGRGLATEGSRALIDQGFSVGVTLVSGRAMKANQASVHVLQKLGLKIVEEYQEPRFPGEDKTAVLLRL